MIDQLEEEFESDDFCVIHANSGVAISIYTVNRLSAKGYGKLFLPITAYSPDMNIIENHWATLKREAKKQFLHTAE